MNDLAQYILKLFRLAVWDREGRMYVPVWDSNGEITHYRQIRGDTQ